jgi:DsbC/DsbD-like thiol-disulfide interchange protein
MDEAPVVAAKFPPTVKPGKVLTGYVTITFSEGLHGYQNPPSKDYLIPVSVSITTKGAKLKPIKYPAGQDETVGGETKPVRVYEGTVKIPVSLTVPKKAGKLKLDFMVHYQQCNQQNCFPPSDVAVSVPVTVK